MDLWLPSSPQAVCKINNMLSEDLQLTAGVPQGTKLGPIRFQNLINDAAADAESEYWKYVDDHTFAALVLYKGIYRMTYMNFPNGHLVMV